MMLQPALDQLDPDPPFWTKTSWIQLGYGLWINLTMVGIGLNFGFSSVAIPQLLEPVSEIMITTNEKAMITSVLTLSSPLGCMICGILMDRCGRSLSLVLCQIPIIFGWFYIGFACSANDIIVGRIIAGFGIGMSMAAPRAYITEMSLPNMRGLIGALPSLATSTGLTIQATLGAFLKWRTVSNLCGVYAFALMCCNCFLPETPYYVILKASATDARNVLAKFRSTNFNVDAELNELKEFKAVNNIHSLTSAETAKALFRPASCKPFGIIMFYTLFMQFAGVNIVVMWTVELLQDSKSSIDPNLGNVLLGLTRIVFGIFTSWLLFRVGKRPLALISAVGLAVVSIFLGTYLHNNTEKSIYPQCFLTAYVAFATLGYYTIPYLMMSELLPLQVRGIMSGIVLSSVNLTIFFVNQIYPSTVELVGFENTFVVYGIVSFFGAVVLYFILPETKGLTLQEIEEYFNDRRPTLVSQRRVMAMQLQALAKNSTISRSNLQRSDSEKEQKRKDKKQTDKKNTESHSSTTVIRNGKRKPEDKKPDSSGIEFRNNN